MAVGDKNTVDNPAPEAASRSRGTVCGRTLQHAIRWFPAVLIVIGIIVLWELVVRLNDIPHWKLPAPGAIGEELWTNWDLLLRHTWVTLQEVMLGFAIALFAGVPTGCTYSPPDLGTSRW